MTIHEITDKINYMSIADYNKESLKSSMKTVVIYFLYGLVHFITKDLDSNWFVNDILLEDINRYKEDKKFRMMITPEKYKDELGIDFNEIESRDNLKVLLLNPEDISLDKFVDFSGFTKIIQYRIFKYIPDPQKQESIKELAKGIREKMRNLLAHEIIGDSYKENTEFLNNIQELIKLINTTKIPEMFSKSQSDKHTDSSVTNLLNATTSKLEELRDNFITVHEEYTIPLDNFKQFDAKKLGSYMVFFDYEALTSSYGMRLFYYMTSFFKPIYITSGVIDSLRKHIKDSVKDKETLKFLMDLSAPDVAKVKIMTVPKKTQGSRFANHVYEEFWQHIEKSVEENEKICIVTGSDSFYNFIVNNVDRQTTGCRIVKIFDNYRVIQTNDNQSIQKEFNLNITIDVSDTKASADYSKTNESNTDASVNEQKKSPIQTGFTENKIDLSKIIMPEPGGKVWVEIPNSNRMEKTLTARTKSGGEGSVFDAKDWQNFKLKFYHPEKIKETDKFEEKIKKIEVMVNCFANNVIFDYVCWPRARVLDETGTYTIGYAMKSAGDAITIEELLANIQAGEETQWTQRTHLIDICQKIAERFKELHSLFDESVLMGDVNPKNIMIKKDAEGNDEIFFIDVDSYQFGEYLCPVGTLEYSSPSVLKQFESSKNFNVIKRTVEDERHAMAVLFFYILFVCEFPYAAKGNGLAESIKAKDYRFKDRFGQESKRNFKLKNLSLEIDNMFYNVFYKNETYNEDQWIKEFKNMKKKIYSKRLSNEIFPQCALDREDESDYFVEDVVCDVCKQPFTESHTVYERNRQHECNWCARCKALVASSRSKIFVLTCSKCQRRFTSNEWDLSKKGKTTDINNPVCPDCETHFKLSKMGEFFNPLKENMKQEDYITVENRRDNFKERLQQHLIKAYKNESIDF